jgi:hypothetical protein
MRHAYKVEYFGTLENAPTWVHAKWHNLTLVLIRRCIRCQLANLHFMNAQNGQRVQSGEPFRPFARRSVYPDNYLWHGDKATKERPVTPDFNQELFNRWQEDND